SLVCCSLEYCEHDSSVLGCSPKPASEDTVLPSGIPPSAQQDPRIQVDKLRFDFHSPLAEQDLGGNDNQRSVADSQLAPYGLEGSRRLSAARRVLQNAPTAVRLPGIERSDLVGPKLTAFMGFSLRRTTCDRRVNVARQLLNDAAPSLFVSDP